MKPGKITQTAWNRSVKRQLHTEGQDPVFHPSYEENCSGLKACREKPEEIFVWSSAAVSGDSPETAWYAAFEAAGELAARGVPAQGISLRILFPEEAQEELLEAAAEAARAACGQTGAVLTCLQGEVSCAVRSMTAFAEAAGTASGTELTGSMRPGQEIILCGCIGLEGMLRILDEAGEEPGGRFVPAFLRQAEELRSELVMPGQIVKVCGTESAGGEPLAAAVRQIGSGGILAALWEMAERSGCGMEVNMDAMTLKQETVEICEYYQLNPYQMTSAGSYLIATEHAEELLRVLEKEGVRAGRLGIARAQAARVITSKEETRYLDRPAPDSLTGWQRTRLKKQERIWPAGTGK